MKKIIAVILAVSLLMSASLITVSADDVEKREDVIFVESADDVAALDRDIPVVEIPGFGEVIYKGLETEDEDDDVSIFFPASEIIMPAVKAHAPGILLGLLTKDFDRIDKHIGPFVLEAFGEIGAEPDGTMKEGTGKKHDKDLKEKEKYGYDDTYTFFFDWRKDMHTLAGELNDYIEEVKEFTGSDKVALMAFSQGNCVLSTYLYEYYFNEENEEKREEIDAVLFVCSAMLGVGSCEDPFSGNIKFDSISLLRFLKDCLSGSTALKGVYYIIEMLYSIGFIDSLVETLNEYVETRLPEIVDPYLVETFGALPGFYAMMSAERYKEAEEFIFNSPELKEKYSGMIEKNRYYHEEVQPRVYDMIDMLMSEGKNVGIVAEYGSPIAPVTSDNDRMTDASICTANESLGAVCADVDGILGYKYEQAKECECGKNHVSPDLQIDASTCAYPDITWFAKGLKHDGGRRFWENLFDLIIYSDEQITVWDYSDFPQFMVSYKDSYLIPLETEGTPVNVPFETTMVFGKSRAEDASAGV